MNIYKSTISIEAETIEEAQGMLGQMILEVPNEITDYLVRTMEEFEYTEKPSAILGDRNFDLSSNETMYDEDIDEPKKDPPKVKPKKKKETEEFKREVKKMKETEPGSGVYKIGDSSPDDGSVIFVGSLGSDYDAGTGMVNTPTGQVNINDIQGTAGGTYDATTGNTFQWRVSDPGEDEWWRQKW